MSSVDFDDNLMINGEVSIMYRDVFMNMLIPLGTISHL